MQAPRLQWLDASCNDLGMLGPCPLVASAGTLQWLDLHDNCLTQMK